MSSTAELAAVPPEVLEEKESINLLQGRKRRIATGVGLTALAIGGGLAEQRGLQHQWPEVIRFVTESSKHPVLGYAGAWAAAKWSRKHKLGASIAVASGADFVAEAGQLVAFDTSHDPLEFVARDAQPGNIYDYGFTILGAAFFAMQNRRFFKNWV